MCLDRLLALPGHWQIWRKRVNHSGGRPSSGISATVQVGEGWVPALGRHWADTLGGGHEGGQYYAWCQHHLPLGLSFSYHKGKNRPFARCPHMWRACTCQVLV